MILIEPYLAMVDKGEKPTEVFREVKMAPFFFFFFFFSFEKKILNL
jgi:hypothetical protein